MERAIVIAPGVEIPASEVKQEFSRASGPGGQHVNKTETRVTLRVDVVHSPSLRDEDRERMLARLAPRLTKAGELLVSAERFRDRTQNIADAFERLQAILRAAWFKPKKRLKTRTPKRAHARRLDDKRRTSGRKEGRRKPGAED